MKNIIVATFDTEAEALKGLAALKDLHKVGDIKLYATAVLVKDASGAVTLKQKDVPGPVGPVGTLAGGTVGMLGGPVGVVVGMSAGALTGLCLDLAEWGIREDLVNEVLKHLAPGKAVVLAQVDETRMAPIDIALGLLGAVVSRRPRSDVVADQRVRELEAFDREQKEARDQFARTGAANKAALQKKTDAVRNHLESIRAKNVPIEKHSRERKRID